MAAVSDVPIFTFEFLLFTFFPARRIGFLRRLIFRRKNPPLRP
jgi:hypothetical protein